MAERLTLGGALHLDHAAIFHHHHVHIGFCGRIFHILQIAQCFAANDTDRNCGNHPFHRVGFQFTGGNQRIQRIGQRHTGTGDGSGTGAAIGLQHIAVQGDGELTELFQIHCGTQ
ncbi:hypothetical protein D3C79_870550 [compost metagenome]